MTIGFSCVRERAILCMYVVCWLGCCNHYWTRVVCEGESDPLCVCLWCVGYVVAITIGLESCERERAFFCVYVRGVLGRILQSPLDLRRVRGRSIVCMYVCVGWVVSFTVSLSNLQER